MSTTAISLRVNTEVLERFDQRAADKGESRSEYILRWLPTFYGDDWGEQPELPDVAGAPTKISISVPNDVLERLDEVCERESISRTDYILAWQPTNYSHDDCDPAICPTKGGSPA